ncbi:MAG: PQQ-binding-like beta-propeller repeat protein [Planctomycetota bacterium]
MTRSLETPARWMLLLGLVLQMGCEFDGHPGGIESQPSRQSNDDKGSSQLTETGSQDWPQLFGINRTCYVATKPANLIWSARGPAEVWSVEVGTGYGSVVVANGRAVFAHRVDDEEIIDCVDAETGQSVWQHRYVTTTECVYEYSDGPYSTPVIFDGLVHCMGGNGMFHCLSLDSGEIIWKRDLHAEYAVEPREFPMGSTPLVAGQRLFLNLGAVDRGAGIVCLDCITGETVWSATDHEAGFCTPYLAWIHDQAFLFVYTGLGLVSLHPETGDVDWVIEHFGRSPQSYNSVSPMVFRDLVMVCNGPGPGARCVRVLPDRSYEPVWKNRRVIDSQFNTLMRRGNQVFTFSPLHQGGAELRCADIRTGELNWKFPSVLRRGQGLIAGDTIIAVGELGHLAALQIGRSEPNILTMTTEPVMSDPCYCAPALVGNRLFLKDEQRVACFALE